LLSGRKGKALRARESRTTLRRSLTAKLVWRHPVEGSSVIVERGNSYSELIGAPRSFLENAERHLSIPIEVGVAPGTRFGRIFWHEGLPFGSLLNGNRVAAGLTWHVEQLAERYSVPCEVKDLRVRPAARGPWGALRVGWRSYQDDVHEQIVRHGVGVVNAPPRSGKTLMAARAIDYFGLSVLYIAPSVAIVRQTYEVMRQAFGDDLIARLDGESFGSDRDASRPIVISTLASAVRQPPEWFKTREMLIIDEFHHAAADSYHRINSLCGGVFYRLCFTGTHFRTGGDGLSMEAVCSQMIHQITFSDLVPQYLAAPKVFFLSPKARQVRAGSWKEAYEMGVVDCKARNSLVVLICEMLRSKSVPTIVLTRRRAHADALGRLITDSAVVKGGENALTSRSVHDFLDGRYSVLVGTTVLGEGVDVPKAGALVYASGGGDGVTMLQSYFRPLTAYPGKDVARIYDFYDTHHSSLLRNSKERLNFARQHLGDCVSKH
jgi:superfamily II DNA or RNA helicase